MPLNAKSVANYFLDLAKLSGDAISPMKLQKLVYYAHGWYAGYTGTPLINENVEAWQYGPVIPSLYHEFKRFGSATISCKATDFEGMQIHEVLPPADPAMRQFLENVWRSYGQFTGITLSEMTHSVDGPWYKTWSESGGLRGVDIPFDSIRDHFTTAVTRSKQPV